MCASLGPIPHEPGGSASFVVRAEIPQLGALHTSSRSRQWRARSVVKVLPFRGAAGIRTPDLRRAKAALSRLSYGPPSEPSAARGGRAWTRTRDLGLIRAAL
jgi:hypothetical protein